MVELQYCPVTFLRRETNVLRNWQGNYVIRYTLRIGYRRNTSPKRYSSNRLQGGERLHLFLSCVTTHFQLHNSYNQMIRKLVHDGQTWIFPKTFVAQLNLSTVQ
jgi:hypothetical protein